MKLAKVTMPKEMYLAITKYCRKSFEQKLKLHQFYNNALLKIIKDLKKNESRELLQPPLIKGKSVNVYVNPMIMKKIDELSVKYVVNRNCIIWTALLRYCELLGINKIIQVKESL